MKTAGENSVGECIFTLLDTYLALVLFLKPDLECSRRATVHAST